MKHLDDSIEKARDDFHAHFKVLGSKFRLVILNNLSGNSFSPAVTVSYPFNAIRSVNGNEHQALPKDGEDVSLRLIFDKRNYGGRDRVRVTVQNRLERGVSSFEAIRRASELHDLVHDWMKDRADLLGPHYARVGTPQERYLMKDERRLFD